MQACLQAAGTLALIIYSVGVLGRFLVELTKNQDKRPLRTIQAMGA